MMKTNLEQLNRSILRISKIEITNFRNILKGSINIPIHDPDSKASITGIYGMNGSGKTSVITALFILKKLISSERLNSDIARQINVDEKEASFSFTLDILDQHLEPIGKLVYSFKIRAKEENEKEGETETKIITEVFDETLKAACYLPDSKFRLQDVLKVTSFESQPLEPEAKAKKLLGSSVDNPIDLVFEKRLASRESRSFLFSSWLIKALDKEQKISLDKPFEADLPKGENELQFMREVFFRLKQYAINELYIATTQQNSLLGFEMLPLMVRDPHLFGTFLMDLDKPFPLPAEILEADLDILSSLNKVLKEIVPELSLSMRTLEKRLDKSGQELVVVQLISHKNQKEIPLKFESEGIKKIISILHLLICIYNQPSITVAVDELDSGIFEYLLGELLKILQDYGKGQLIFTSHNLRPLETLNKSSILFSTTNPLNRFIRMQNVKSNNNLRNMYYRDIFVSEQSEELYHASNPAMVALAFRAAGKKTQ